MAGNHTPDVFVERETTAVTRRYDAPASMLDEPMIDPMRSEYLGEGGRQAPEDGRRGCQRHAHREQRRFVDEQCDVRLPEQRRRIPGTQRASR
jgi:hypothetical protein